MEGVRRPVGQITALRNTGIPQYGANMEQDASMKEPHQQFHQPVETPFFLMWKLTLEFDYWWEIRLQRKFLHDNEPLQSRGWNVAG